MKEEEKTYIVYQDCYSCGYNIYDPEDKDGEGAMPRQDEITEEFEAEEGTEWYGYSYESQRVSLEDLGEAGYTTDDIVEMGPTDRYRVMASILTDEDLEDLERGSNIEECSKYKTCIVSELEEDDGYLYFCIEVKFRFLVEDGEVKGKLVR